MKNRRGWAVPAAVLVIGLIATIAVALVLARRSGSANRHGSSDWPTAPWQPSKVECWRSLRCCGHRWFFNASSLKVIFTTGYTRNAIVHDGRLDEGVAFLQKPFTAPALAGKIRRELDA